MGAGMAYGGLPFSGTGCPTLDVGNFTWFQLTNILDTVFAFIPLPRKFLSTESLLKTKTIGPPSC